MEDLLSIAGEVMENFNPATDSADDFESLPDDSYTCLLEDVEHRKSDNTGNHWIGFKFSVSEGDYTGRLLFVNYFFTVKNAKRATKQILKLAYSFGYELPLDSFSNLDTLAESLKQIAGNQAIVRQTTKNDYSNYAVDPIV